MAPLQLLAWYGYVLAIPTTAHNGACSGCSHLQNAMYCSYRQQIADMPSKKAFHAVCPDPFISSVPTQEEAVRAPRPFAIATTVGSNHWIGGGIAILYVGVLRGDNDPFVGSMQTVLRPRPYPLPPICSIAVHAVFYHRKNGPGKKLPLTAPNPAVYSLYHSSATRTFYQRVLWFRLSYSTDDKLYTFQYTRYMKFAHTVTKRRDHFWTKLFKCARHTNWVADNGILWLVNVLIAFLLPVVAASAFVIWARHSWLLGIQARLIIDVLLWACHVAFACHTSLLLWYCLMVMLPCFCHATWLLYMYHACSLIHACLAVLFSFLRSCWLVVVTLPGHVVVMFPCFLSCYTNICFSSCGLIHFMHVASLPCCHARLLLFHWLVAVMLAWCCCATRLLWSCCCWVVMLTLHWLCCKLYATLLLSCCQIAIMWPNCFPSALLRSYCLIIVMLSY